MGMSAREVQYFDRICDIPLVGRVTLRVVDPVVAPNATNPKLLLRCGDSGDAVFQLNQALAYLGYLDSRSVDREFSSETDEALRKFQSDRKLKVDGVYGSSSETSLDIALNGGVGQSACVPHSSSSPAPAPPAPAPPPAQAPPPQAATPPAPAPQPTPPPPSNTPRPTEPAASEADQIARKHGLRVKSGPQAPCDDCATLERALADGSYVKCVQLAPKEKNTNAEVEKIVKAVQRHFVSFLYWMGGNSSTVDGVDGGYGGGTARVLGEFRNARGLTTRSANTSSFQEQDIRGIIDACRARFATALPATAGLGAVPFAPRPTGTVFWPLVDPINTIVHRGDFHKRDQRGSSRHFGARRGDGARVHVGIDLFGRDGDTVVAIESGTIVNFYRFLGFTRNGVADAVWAIIVRCDSGVVINYGEVNKNSNKTFKWSIGDRIEAGQPFAQIAKMERDTMLHFETYTSDATKNERWQPAQGSPPRALRNPTEYLEHLARHGYVLTKS